MITKDSSIIGLKTRFGANWKGERCFAKTKNGGLCPKPAYKSTGRCHNHGGASSGPKTYEGRQRISKANLKHGNYTIEKKQERVKSAAIGRKLNAQIKLIENDLKKEGII